MHSQDDTSLQPYRSIEWNTRSLFRPVRNVHWTLISNALTIFLALAREDLLQYLFSIA